MQKNQKMTYSKLNCENCGNLIKIPRFRGKWREEGHVKHMYCYKCQEITAHIETHKDSMESYWDSWQDSQR